MASRSMENLLWPNTQMHNNYQKEGASDTLALTLINQNHFMIS